MLLLDLLDYYSVRLHSLILMQAILILCVLFALSATTNAQENDIRANLSVYYYKDDGVEVVTRVHDNIAVLREQQRGTPENVITNGQVEQFQFTSEGVIPRPGNVMVIPPGGSPENNENEPEENPGNEPDEEIIEISPLPNETTTAGENPNEITPTDETSEVGGSVAPPTPSGETTTTLEASADGETTAPSGMTTTAAAPTDETSETDGNIASTTPSGETTTTLEASTDGETTAPSETTSTAAPTDETFETDGNILASTTPSNEPTTTLEASVDADMTSTNGTIPIGAGAETDGTSPVNETSNEGGITIPSSETTTTTEAAADETGGSSENNSTTPSDRTTTTPGKTDTPIGGNSGEESTTPIKKTSTTDETPNSSSTTTPGSTTVSSNRPTPGGRSYNETGIGLYNIIRPILRELGYDNN